VQPEKIADGVFYLRGGTHHSVAVEFADHVVVIEAPLNQQRSEAVIAEVKKLIPNKPIRYIVNTHHHFDHSGGLRTYVTEGATIVTSELNKEFYQTALAATRIDTVGNKRVLSDGARSLELYTVAGNQHADGILMAFLPREKLLVEVDVYTPGPASGVNANTANLVENVERLKLKFETVLPLHGPGAVSRSDLYAAIGRPAPKLSEILAPAQVQSSKATDPGQVLETACSGCHGLSRVQSQSMSRAEWQAVVDRMRERGAEVADLDMSVLVDYLAKTYGRK
jgi:glyoxylase-like metal-dependent hydrolase (beta-lactamase superfamily II)